MTCISFGEGRRIPAMGAAGAQSAHDRTQSRPRRAEAGRQGRDHRKNNIIETIKPGETVTNMNPGGGGYGNPLRAAGREGRLGRQERPGLASKARSEDYGVVIADPESLPSTSKPRDAQAARCRLSGRAAMRTKYRLGIDAGGTFTDFVLAEQSARSSSTRRSRRRPIPTRAIENGLELMAGDLGDEPYGHRLELRSLHQRHHGRPQCPDPAQRAARPA